jgi:polyisoprenoid-binding protein YceI
MSTFPAELTGTWAIDESHSTIGFAVKHAVVATTRGTFTSYSGGATIDAEKPELSTAWVEIDAKSVNTGNPQRDGHLASADFWNADANPKIIYRSTAARPDGDQLIMTGDLTIGGTTAPVDITWAFNGTAKDPWGNTKAGFEGTATINRKDWGISYNAVLETGGVLIGEKVKLVLEIEAAKQA